MSQYIALLRKEADSDYGVDFPDFPGCITAGGDLDQARRMAEEALALHVRGMMEDGEALPEPGRLEAIMADPANAGAVAFLVGLPPQRDRAVRVNITIPEKLLAEIDNFAEAKGYTRSGLIVRATRELMESDED